MIPYPHFAFPSLYLTNGYTATRTHHGIELEFELEDRLEHCVRRLVLHKPERLHGHELRFLRRGLDLSQAEFGQMVDRDAQTVARWEKGSDPLPKFVDMTIRVRFAARFEPNMSLREVLSCVDGVAPKYAGKIFLSFDGRDWSYDFAQRIPYTTGAVRVTTSADLPVGPGLLIKVLEKQWQLASEHVWSESPTVTVGGAHKFDSTPLGAVHGQTRVFH